MNFQAWIKPIDMPECTGKAQDASILHKDNGEKVGTNRQYFPGKSI